MSERHTLRLKEMIDEIREKEKCQIFGGQVDISQRFVEPTLVDNPSLESKVMQDEIFGPILPMIAIDDDIEKLWERDELCSSDDSVFIGSGVCDGRTRGVKINGDGTASVHSEIIDVASGEHKFVSRTREF